MSTPINIIEYRIGRNVNGVPMEQDEWDRFVADTQNHLDGIAVGLQYEAVRKLQQWTEVHISEAGRFQGETEESAVVTLYTDIYSSALNEPLRDLLVHIAGELAWEFDQIAVALVWQGQSTLVPSRMEEAIAEEEELDAMLGIVVGALLGEDD